MAYQRLGTMKKIDAEFKADPEKAKKENRAAIELGVSIARLECKEHLRKVFTFV